MTKQVEQEIAIEADADTVWRAITEGEEIKRWFPLDARTRPGKGGAIWFSFGEGMSWESPIEVWEPGKRLQTVDTAPGEPPQRLAVDYTLEGRGGTTILRLVHSGFADDAWEDELDTMNAGWASFLANLKHYLEKHPGEPREVAYFRHEPIGITRPEALVRTLHAFGFPAEKAFAPGDRVSITTEEGDHFQGVIQVFKAPINLTMSVENWDDGWLMIEIEPGRDRCRPAAWLSLYGGRRHEAPAVAERLKKLLLRAMA